LYLGNFSFAHALVKHRLDGHGQSIIATAYDSEEVTRVKYPEVDEHVNAIKAAGATVLFNVDGTNLSATSALKGRRFTKIVFNFPHAGAGIKDQDRNIRVNQELILGFFHSAIHFLTGPEHGDAIAGEIHVTLKSGMPYDQWNVRQLARAAGLACRRSLAFRPQIYPGYVHRRTLGFQEGLSAAENEEIIDKQPKTIIFIRAAPPDETTTKRKKQTASARNTKKRRVPTNQDSDDSDGDIKDNIEENDDDIFVE
jgi:25S rRNA (uracil2634-N3)-methyltransferase